MSEPTKPSEQGVLGRVTLVGRGLLPFWPIIGFAVLAAALGWAIPGWLFALAVVALITGDVMTHALIRRIATIAEFRSRNAIEVARETQRVMQDLLSQSPQLAETVEVGILELDKLIVELECEADEIRAAAKSSMLGVLRAQRRRREVR